VGYNGVVLWTTDGGASWTPQSVTPVFNLDGIAFLGPQTAIVVGANILRTTDGGATWETLLRASTASVAFADRTTGVAVERTNGDILRTTEGGDTWTPQNITSRSIYSVAFADANTGVVVGNRVLLLTSDAGVTWTEQGVKEVLWDVAFGD